MHRVPSLKINKDESVIAFLKPMVTKCCLSSNYQARGACLSPYKASISLPSTTQRARLHLSLSQINSTALKLLQTHENADSFPHRGLVNTASLVNYFPLIDVLLQQANMSHQNFFCVYYNHFHCIGKER